jgi:cytochrome c553
MIKATSLLLALAGFFSAAQAQDVAAGQKKAAMCIGCHGIPGYQATFPQVHKVPMIAGQGAGYITAALNAYASGERKHPTMRGIAATLTEKDVADLSAFYEQQGKGNKAAPSEAAVAPPAAVAELLTKGACASCHGANFNKPVAPNYPKVAGQHSDYLLVALKSYQQGGSPLAVRGNAIMAGQVKQFTPAELKQIASYLGSLPGELQTVPQSRFR